MTIASLKGSYELPAPYVPVMKVEKLLMVAEVLYKRCRLQSVISLLVLSKLGLGFFPITETLEVKLDSDLLLKVSKPLVTAKRQQKQKTTFLDTQNVSHVCSLNHLPQNTCACLPCCCIVLLKLITGWVCPVACCNIPMSRVGLVHPIAYQIIYTY